ncbi:MAG: CheR family methyltransferase [Polyangia bacterium]
MERRLHSRAQGLSQVVAHHLGIDVSRQSAALLTQLLDALPVKVDLEDRAALRTIAQTCAIGETCFLRHPEHFNALRELLPTLPSWRQRAPLRVWSAGCSSGEEAYSLAAVLLPAWLGRIEILGTDVREDAITHARIGRYRRWSLRGTSESSVAGWLLTRGPDALEVHSSLRELVEFRVHNLVRDPFPQGLDVLFCRNVLMYFHAGAAAAVLAGFEGSLRPGGVLVVGDVDPAPEGAPWSEQRCGGVRIFRRGPDPLPALVPPRPPPDAVEVARSAAAPERTTTPPGPPAVQLEPVLTRVRRLFSLGEHEAGLALLREVAAQFPLEAAPQILLCMLARDTCRAAVAREAARRACFLCPEQPMSRFLMGACLFDAGERQQARIHLRAATALLSALPEPSRPVPFGEGLTGLHVQRMIDAYNACL